MGPTETQATNKYRKMVEISGLRNPGQTVKVNGGRHAGLKTIVHMINWDDAEVLLETKSGAMRWFGIAMVTVMDPIRTPLPENPAAAPTSPPKPLEPVAPLPVPPAPVVSPKAAPSWLPKPKIQ